MTESHHSPEQEIRARGKQGKTDPYQALVFCLMMLGIARTRRADLLSLKAVWVALQRGKFRDDEVAFAKHEARDFLARWGLPDRPLV